MMIIMWCRLAAGREEEEGGVLGALRRRGPPEGDMKPATRAEAELMVAAFCGGK